MLTLPAAEAMAGRVMAARYPDADAVMLTGSHARGEATPGSDLDLVVLYERLPQARRESFTFEGTPVEVFIHDPETLAWSLKADIDAGKPAMHNMVAEGRVQGPRPETLLQWQVRAQARLAAGPAPLTQTNIQWFRYHITDRLIDLADERDPAEVVAIGLWLYLGLAELMLRGRGRWMGTGKWIPRHLRALDPALEREFSAAFGALFARHDAGAVVALAEAELARHGGRLFDGYESEANVAERIADESEAG